MNTKIKREKEQEVLPSEATDEDEQGPDDSSDSSSDESSSESSQESASEVAKREMSEREQFELQAKYRRLDRALIQQRTEVARENGIQVVSTSLDIADQLFSETKASIQSNIVAKDAATLKEIGVQAKLATRNLKLGRSERVLDFNEFSSNFLRFFATEDDVVDVDSPIDRGMARFDWIKAGLLYASCSRRAPSAEFLLGPLEITRKTRVSRPRLQDDSKSGASRTASKRSASELMEQDRQDDTTANSERCFRKLRTLNMARKNLFEFFIDPKSFARSVENLFYTSFLINHGKIILGRDATGVPYVQEANSETFKHLPRYVNRDDSKSHIILSLDHVTWRALIDRFAIQEAFL
ncbi:hypothetical protein KL928_003364 [Ogataea angusta]|uniref:Non-structural maintenance of chromosomes element 4 n=1 Tax=Pichia angusta TaxID=870730 RepID=A0AAN6I5D3_PICAN|nr:uncharacterized protein KL928_003364 [Ogataea angusta]KAG7818363.1 hypothetical protein KL928_003364 [Ogataea angusta]